MLWFKKKPAEKEQESKEEFVKLLRHGSNYLKKEYAEAKEYIHRGVTKKTEIETKIKMNLPIVDGDYLVIYDFDHYVCKASPVGYCGSLLNSIHKKRKQPCLWCGKQI